jgi:hypothetical protein
MHLAVQRFEQHFRSVPCAMPWEARASQSWGFAWWGGCCRHLLCRLTAEIMLEEIGRRPNSAAGEAQGGSAVAQVWPARSMVFLGVAKGF